MESKKDDSGTIPESSNRSLAAGYLSYKLSTKWDADQPLLPLSIYAASDNIVICKLNGENTNQENLYTISGLYLLQNQVRLIF